MICPKCRRDSEVSIRRGCLNCWTKKQRRQRKARTHCASCPRELAETSTWYCEEHLRFHRKWRRAASAGLIEYRRRSLDATRQTMRAMRWFEWARLSDVFAWLGIEGGRSKDASAFAQAITRAFRRGLLERRGSHNTYEYKLTPLGMAAAQKELM